MSGRRTLGAAIACALLAALAGAGGAAAAPRAIFSHGLDGAGDEAARAVALDARGNTYVAGETSSADFPLAGPAARRARPGAATSAFVAKLDPAGRLIYATLLGGRGVTLARGIAVDAAGRAYVAGATNATDFPTTRAARQRSYGGGPFDAFVTQLDARGRIAYSTFLGDTHYDEANAIAVDRGGHAVITGRTASPQFPRAGALRPPVIGGAFVAKLDRRGARLLFSTVFGGDDQAGRGTTGFAIAVDRAGATYAAGVTNATTLRPTPFVLQPALAGGGDAFVTKIDPAGRAVVYTTYLGAGADDSARAIAADAAGNAYVAGITRSTDLRTRSALQGASAGGADAFAAKLDPRGGRLVYATYLGGGADDGASAIAVSPSGAVAVTGHTASPDFPLAAGGRRGGGAFLTRLGASGAGLPTSTTLGDPAAAGLGLALGRSGRLVVVGRTGDGADGAALVSAIRAVVHASGTSARCDDAPPALAARQTRRCCAPVASVTTSV